MKKLNHKNTASRQFLFLLSFDVGKVTKGMPNVGRIFFTKIGQFLSFSLNLAFRALFPVLPPFVALSASFPSKNTDSIVANNGRVEWGRR